MGNLVISPTWDEYLAALSTFLLGVGKMSHDGFRFALIPPERPTYPMVEKYRIRALQLQEECDREAIKVLAQMEAIAGRTHQMRHGPQGPHHEYPVASYFETHI